MLVGDDMNYNRDLASFYDSKQWKCKREAILVRDKYQCQECRRYGKLVEAKEVHHKVHLEDAPELAFDDDNLVSLCKACHRKCHPEKGTKSQAERYGKHRYYY
jgi:5-methylcytosine-specific restriction endonuclease McrA